MISNITTRNAMLLGIATTLAGAGALILRRMNHARGTRPAPHHDVPIWAQAAAIVASSASALLLLVHQKA